MTTEFSDYKKGLILRQETSFKDVINAIKAGHFSLYVEAARRAGKGTKEYERIKARVPAFTPHGCFKGAKNSDLESLSGFIYIDIDNQVINMEALKTIPSLYACWRSISGQGYSLLFRSVGYAKEELNEVILAIATKYNIPHDKNATSLNRAVCISSDADLFFNPDAVPFLYCKGNNEEQPFSQGPLDKNNSTPETKKKKPSKSKRIFVPLQDIPVALTAEPYVFAEDEIYHIFPEPILVKEELFRMPIRKGNRYKTLSITAAKLIAIYSERGFSKEQAYNEFLTFNKFCQPDPLEAWEMQRIFSTTMEKFEAGKLMVPCIFRYGAINPNMPEEVKNQAPALIRAEVARRKTMGLIEKAIMQLQEEGVKITQVNVAALTGMSRCTIQRYWKEFKVLLDNGIKLLEVA